MITIINISLENEMDLVLAHKRSMRVAEKLGLTIATQTTFATAVSEIARTVIEHTNNGVLEIGLKQDNMRYSLISKVVFDREVRFTNEDSGFYFAQKLVPEFSLSELEGNNCIEMKIGLPRSLKLDIGKINLLKKALQEDLPLNAYEEIKQRNHNLHKLAGQQEEDLRQSRIINEQKTEFISVASHEIKTPITVIKAYTQLAMRLKEECSPRVNELISKVDAQTTKLLSLVQQLLDISKIENGSLQYKTERLELNRFVTSMVELLSHVYPDYRVSVELTDEIWIEADRLRMEQVFSNILGNACKYSEKNTAVKISFVVQGNYVKIAVNDQGIGMSDKTVDFIFDKFYRDQHVLKTHTGLGMGLYITSKIIALHGGRIWVESREGIGSTFFFTLPLAVA